MADVRPLDRTSSTSISKIVIFCTTYAWTHPPPENSWDCLGLSLQPPENSWDCLGLRTAVTRQALVLALQPAVQKKDFSPQSGTVCGLATRQELAVLGQ